MKLYTFQELHYFDQVSVTKDGEKIEFVFSPAYEGSDPRKFTFDLNAIRQRGDFADHTIWTLTLNSTQISLWNKYLVTQPTRADHTNFLIAVGGGTTPVSILVPFKDSTLDECVLIVGAPELDAIQATGFDVQPQIASRAAVRDITFPSVRAKSVETVEQGVDVDIQLSQNGVDVAREGVCLYLECTAGSLSSQRVYTDATGSAKVRVYDDPFRTGETGKLKVSFKYWSGVADIAYQLP